MLNRVRMSVDGGNQTMLVVFHAEPESPDADKLAVLASASMVTA